MRGEGNAEARVGVSFEDRVGAMVEGMAEVRSEAKVEGGVEASAS